MHSNLAIRRLWDMYLTYRTSYSPDDAPLHQLHIFVCLAILEACHEDIMELDGSEVQWYLQHLPTFDMDQIITQAFNIKDDVIARSIL